MLPFRKAIKLPVYLYGSMRLHCLSGELVIPENVHAGMIKIGYRWRDLWPTSFLPSQINITGTLVFKGSCIVSGGTSIVIQSKNAICEIGDKCVIGGGSVVKSLDKITIGDYTRITGNCVVMNSNMHFVKNIETGHIQKPWGTIKIGSHCWINQGSNVMKGAVVPDYTIAAKGSFISKDYSEYGTNLFLAGSPAKVINNTSQRIFDLKKEKELYDYFRAHPEVDYYDDGVGLFSDESNEIVF
jgi:acetyltransferase-like isoleucine patch superfamily enzyme